MELVRLDLSKLQRVPHFAAAAGCVERGKQQGKAYGARFACVFLLFFFRL